MVLQGQLLTFFTSLKRVFVLILGYNQLYCYFLRLQKKIYNNSVHFRFRILLVKPMRILSNGLAMS